MNERPWKIELGSGNIYILILTRKDYNPLNYLEWQTILKPFYNKAHFIIIDIAEKFLQENYNSSFSIKELAKYLYKYLSQNNIVPNMIWGFSMGGMIAQELKTYKIYQPIPLLLVSTNLCATPKLKAIFSNWYLSLKNNGINDFYQNFYPWILSSDKLPIFSLKIPQIENISSFGVKKLLYSIKSVANHNACDVIKKNTGRIVILFGEKSVLLNKEEANLFRQILPYVKIHFVKNANMRIMNCLDKITFDIINNYIDEMVKKNI